MTESHELSSEERARVNAQVDHFIELIQARYNVKVEDVIDAVRFVRAKREFDGRVRLAAFMSVIALVISALSAAVWEGAKTLLNRHGSP